MKDLVDFYVYNQRVGWLVQSLCCIKIEITFWSFNGRTLRYVGSLIRPKRHLLDVNKVVPRVFSSLTGLEGPFLFA